MGWAGLLPVADAGVRWDRPRPYPNMYISLQTRHFLSVLEADVHVLERAAPDQNCARTPSTTKFTALNNFELSTQFIGQKITLGILTCCKMLL